jgi:hypothetical protein
MKRTHYEYHHLAWYRYRWAGMFLAWTEWQKSASFEAWYEAFRQRVGD